MVNSIWASAPALLRKGTVTEPSKKAKLKVKIDAVFRKLLIIINELANIIIFYRICQHHL